jgi:rfaE bifunctional protein kinase chain/domain
MSAFTKNELSVFSAAFGKARIAVIGDLMLDRYLFGSVTRMSPEAPVPVLDIEITETRLGGAANVGHNLHSLSATPLLVGVVGDDNKGKLMQTLLTDMGFDISGIITDPERPTTTKTRVVAGSQQMLRVDEEKKHPISLAIENQILEVIEKNIASLNAIILEDYNKGVLSESLIGKVIAIAKKNNVPTFVDPKFDNFFAYQGVTVFKPNRKEMQDALGYKTRSDEEINKAGFALLEKLGAENVLLTLSEKGMRLFERGNSEPFAIPTMAREVADVSGAGDTVIATLAVASACGATVRQASVMANRAAGFVVEDLGIVPIYKDQLFDALLEDIEA